MMSKIWGGRASRHTKPKFLPGCESMEGRVVLSTMTGHPVAPAAQVHAMSAPTVNQREVAYLNANLGQRIGGGECAELAIEALRVAGGKFTNIGSDSPAPGDYVWGTLVKSYTFSGGKVVDSKPTTAIQPGDILQFHNAAFSNGIVAHQHTAVVAATDAAGRVTQVFEQNIDSNGVKGVNRKDTLSTLDLSKLTSGYVTVYHPITRVATPGKVEFTVVNNATTPETVSLFGSSTTLNAANTTGSMVTFWGSGQVQLTVNGRSYPVSDAAGYQIVGSGSAATLQRLSS